MDLNKKIIFIVESNKKEIKKPVSNEVIEVIKNGRQTYPKQVDIYRYKLKTNQFPFEVDILEDEISGVEDGYGSGSGDLWQWTYFFSFSKEEAEKWYKKEKIKRNT